MVLNTVKTTVSAIFYDCSNASKCVFMGLIYVLKKNLAAATIGDVFVHCVELFSAHDLDSKLFAFDSVSLYNFWRTAAFYRFIIYTVCIPFLSLKLRFPFSNLACDSRDSGIVALLLWFGLPLLQL